MNMLQQIKVKNYKCFENITFDLSAADYSYNPVLIKDGIVNKALIFGKNGTGKTSLGLAIFDIVQHLTDKAHFPPRFMEYYRNLNTGDKNVFFQYVCSFDYQNVVYEYEKSDAQNLLYEKLKVDKNTLLDYHYGSPDKQFVAPELRGNLDIRLPDNKLSILKYIYRNTPTGFNPILTRIINYTENMLWFRSLSDGNGYCGLINGTPTLEQMLFESGKVRQFQEFLSQNGLQYDLDFEEDGGQPKLYAYFNNRKSKALFSMLVSSDTRVLWLLFNWITKAENKLSLLFIDEFDAFYHYEVAASVVRMLNGMRGFQTILTTHNTYLMQNQFTRPDCCFIMTDKQIKSLTKSTDRELREAHNLEKMYIGGAFVE